MVALSQPGLEDREDEAVNFDILELEKGLHQQVFFRLINFPKHMYFKSMF